MGPRALGPRLVRKGDWNHAIVVLGVPGTGKSTYALQLALELGRTPAYVLAHDPGWRLPARLPDGRPAGLHRHESIAAARAALARDGRGVHVISCADGDEVIRLGKQLARASLAAGGGHAGVPVVVLLDEAVGTPGASPHRLGDELRELLATRRHLHLAIVMTAQSPQLAHYALLTLATEVVLFRMTDDRALRRLEQAGVPSEKLSRVATLPNYQHIVHRLGEAPASSPPSSAHRRETSSRATGDASPRASSRVTSREVTRHRNR